MEKGSQLWVTCLKTGPTWAIIGRTLYMLITIGQIAGLLSFFAYTIYILAILRGETKPARATWWILATVGLITMASYKASGAEDTIWVVVGDFAGVICIAILSLWYGVGGAEKSDIFCFIGAGLSLWLWWYFDSPFVALVTNLVVDCFAAIPTIVKTIKEPELEDRPAWTLTVAANVVSLFAVERWIIAIWIYPVYTLIIDGIVWALLFRKPRNKFAASVVKH